MAWRCWTDRLRDHRLLC